MNDQHKSQSNNTHPKWGHVIIKELIFTYNDFIQLHGLMNDGLLFSSSQTELIYV